LLNIKDKMCTVKLSYRLITFCFTVIKLYYTRPEKDQKDKLIQTQPQVTILLLPAITLLKQGCERLRKYPLFTVTADIKVCI
jgi:hypothetical protein